MRNIYAALFVLVFILAGTPVFAGDTDSSGSKLRDAVNEYIKNAPPGDEDAQKLKASEGANAFEISNLSLLCTVESYSGIGTLIWNSRKNADLCENLHAKNIYDYCLLYSKHCGHWVWWDDCMKFYKCTEKDPKLK